MEKVSKWTTGRVVRYVLIFFLLYVFIASTVPNIWPKKLSEESKQRLDKENATFTSPAGTDYAALIETPENALNVRLLLLQESKESVDIVYHTVHDGGSTDAFLAEVWNAAERGVNVRILLDGKAGSMSPALRKKMGALSAHPNVSYKKYNLISFIKPWTLHSLLHDKFIIVDDEYLLLGGRNIGDRYYAPEGYTRSVTNDRDALVWDSKTKAEESVMVQVNEYMDLLWESESVVPMKEISNTAVTESLLQSSTDFKEKNPRFYEKTLEDYHNTLLSTNRVSLIYNPIDTVKKEPWVAYQLGQLAAVSEEKVLIQTPYSTANKHFLQSLEQAAAEKEVKVLTNSIGSSPNFPAFSNYYMRRERFIDTGAQFFEYQSADSIHGKSMVFDDRISAVGSFNTDDRSMYLDTETMLIIDSPEFAESLTQAIGHYKASALEVGRDNRYIQDPQVAEVPASGVKKAVMWLASLMSRLFQPLI